MADRYNDFDAAVIEEGKQNVTFTMGGRLYTLPPDLPAKVILVHMRRLQDDGTVPQSVMSDWLSALVGEDNLEQMFDDGVTWKQMEALFNWLLDEYELRGASEGEESEEGDSPN